MLCGAVGRACTDVLALLLCSSCLDKHRHLIAELWEMHCCWHLQSERTDCIATEISFATALGLSSGCNSVSQEDNLGAVLKTYCSIRADTGTA